MSSDAPVEGQAAGRKRPLIQLPSLREVMPRTPVLQYALRCDVTVLIRQQTQVQSAEQTKTPANRFQPSSAASIAAGNPARRCASSTKQVVVEVFEKLQLQSSTDPVPCWPKAIDVQAQEHIGTNRCSRSIQPGHWRLQPCSQEQPLSKPASTSISSPPSAAGSSDVLPAAWHPSQRAHQASRAVYIQPRASCSASAAGTALGVSQGHISLQRAMNSVQRSVSQSSGRIDPQPTLHEPLQRGYSPVCHTCTCSRCTDCRLLNSGQLSAVTPQPGSAANRAAV